MTTRKTNVQQLALFAVKPSTHCERCGNPFSYRYGGCTDCIGKKTCYVKGKKTNKAKAGN